MRLVKPRIVIGLSGGVDSAVAAVKLQRAGFEVVGLFAQSWDDLDETGVCQGEQDWEDAKAVAKQLSIEVERVDLVKHYWNEVFQNFVEEYRRGRTPNPDVACNSAVKFGPLMQHAGERVPHVQSFATGHYARLLPGGRLARAADAVKDQTLFLCRTARAALKHVEFPLGEMVKGEVREFARAEGLVNAERRSSRGICFIGKRSMKEFLPNYLDMTPGAFVHVDDPSHPLAHHDGAECYTVGQRAKYGGAEERMYVAGKNLQTGTVFVAEGGHPSLYCSGVYLSDMKWMDPDDAYYNGPALFRYRHGDPLQECTIKMTSLVGRVDFDGKLEKGVAPGQTMALYTTDGMVLGGGQINERVANKA